MTPTTSRIVFVALLAIFLSVGMATDTLGQTNEPVLIRLPGMPTAIPSNDGKMIMSVTPKMSTTEVVISNANGKVECTVARVGRRKVELDLRDLPSGSYVIHYKKRKRQVFLPVDVSR